MLRRSDGLSGAAGVLGVVPREQPFLVLALREEEEADDGADQDRDEARGVRPVRAVEERLLGSGGDRGRVLQPQSPPRPQLSRFCPVRASSLNSTRAGSTRHRNPFLMALPMSGLRSRMQE